MAVMRDLKKLWRKDDTDDERTVFRCFAKAGLCIELLCLVDECTGRGENGRKIALAATDLLAALTWPIDVQKELTDMLEDAETVITDYASLLRHQVTFKNLILRSGMTIRNFMILLLPSLALANRDRTEKDRRIISLMLHMIRNLLAIRDPVGTGVDVGQAMELGSLQSQLIVQLEESRFIPLMLTLAENADKSEFEEYNVLVLDALWLIYRTVEVEDLVQPSNEASSSGALSKLLEEEERGKQQSKRTVTSRHSRFGTTLSIYNGKQRYILHKQSSITTSAGQVIDGIKKKRAGQALQRNQLTVKPTGNTPLSKEALQIVKDFAGQFLLAFDNFFHSILKDIRIGRSKIRETDNVRVLYLCRFFMEYFMTLRKQEKEAKAKKQREKEMAKRQAAKARDPLAAAMDFDDDSFLAELEGRGDGDKKEDEEESEESMLDFRLLAEIFQDDTRGWLAKRLDEAKEAKPRADLEIQACLDFFTQLLEVIAEMAGDEDEEIAELSDTLSAKLLHSADFIDIAYDCLRTYKNQSMAYLDSAINFTYTLIKTLERYSKDKGSIHTRKKRDMKRRKEAREAAGQEFHDEDEQAAALEKEKDTYLEQSKQFQYYERRLADDRIVSTLIRYLGRYREMHDVHRLKRLVSLIHRIVVSCQSETVFFKVSTCNPDETPVQRGAR